MVTQMVKEYGIVGVMNLILLQTVSCLNMS